MRKVKLWLSIAALAGVGWLALSGVAYGDARPIRFEPAPGSVLDSPPTSVTAWLSAELRRADETFIQVLDAEGADVATAEVQLSDDRRQMSVTLASGLAEGRYVVFWSALDDGDGHTVAECYAFFVGQAAADAAVENRETLDAAAECPAEEQGHTDEAEPDTGAASVAISIPEVINGDSATLEITPTNFTPRKPDGSTVDPHFGHYHIYLDKVPVDLLTGHGHEDDAEDHEDGDAVSTGSAGGTEDHAEDVDGMAENTGGLVENPVMTFENTFTFTNLEPGYHTVVVALTYDDHSLFDPPVLAAQTFRVEGGGDDDGGIPVWALALGIIGGLIAGGAGMKLVGSRV